MKDNFFIPPEFVDWDNEKGRKWASVKGESGFPRWMEPFSPVDIFGNPTVFADKENSAIFAKCEEEL